MEIRSLEAGERESLLELLDSWQLPDGWRGRDYFRRYVDLDPSYADENVLVAVDGGKLVSCVQIFPRRIRILGHAIPAGGIGSVFTLPDRRREGLSYRLLEAAIERMIEGGMEVSLLFSLLTDFYGHFGWRAWNSDRSILRRSDAGPPPSGALDSRGDDEIEIVPFAPERDLADVKAIHSAYSAPRNGTVVRDDALWSASLAMAGNPSEEFLVARRGGTPHAYVRATILNGLLTITELGRREDAAEPLALLMARMLEERKDDPLAPPQLPSRQLRSAMLLPAFDDLLLTLALEQRGLATHPIEDPSYMLRCLEMPALAARLDIALFPNEVPDEFLARILPRDSLVFWPADRF